MSELVCWSADVLVCSLPGQRDQQPKQRADEHLERGVPEQLQQALLVEALILDHLFEHPVQDAGLDADRPPDAGRVVEDDAGEDERDGEQRRG